MSRTPNRKHIRKGILQRYSQKTQFGDYFSTGAADGGIVRAYDRTANVWHSIPEAYFRAEFWTRQSACNLSGSALFDASGEIISGRDGAP
jgi:hypothetical protein